MSTAVKSENKKKGTEKLASTEVSKKLARNLNEQFDRYTLRQEYSFDQKHNQTPARLLNQSVYSNNTRNKENHVSQPLQNSVKEGTIPKSYLLAMQHLQDTVDERDQQIQMLKQELMEKETHILECQTRINEALKKCQSLSSNLQQKQMELEIMKAQNSELRLDKDAAIRQAAKHIEAEYKPQLSQQIPPTKFSRSKTFHQPRVNASSYVHQTPVETYNPQYQELSGNFTKTDGFGIYSHRPDQFDSLPVIPPLLSYRDGEENFISYQRQILRQEKEMTALTYRMQCLERKLLSNEGNKDQTKQKIRRLSQDISAKERRLKDLKQLI